MSEAIHITVAAVVARDGRHLLVEERDDQGGLVYNQPAGHLEPGESLIEAVQREVMEETTRPFTPTGLTGIYRWPMPGSGRTYVRFCFCGEVGEPLPGAVLDPDIQRTLWLDPARLDAGFPSRSPLVLRCIADASTRPPIPLEYLDDVV